jgi:hypothetical protein
MLARNKSRINSARARELGLSAAMGIRRPCNTTFVDCVGKGIQ